MQSISMQELIAARIAAKRAEDDAIKARREVDAQIAELLRDPQKPEGSISQKADGYKVTVTYKIDRKVDADNLVKSWEKLPIDVQSAFKWKPELSVSEFRKLDDKAKLNASKFITAKDATPSITIEAV